MVDLRFFPVQGAAIFLTVMLAVSPVPGQEVVDLAQASADIEIIGEPAQHKTGHALAIGDVNGDGIVDLIVGAPDWRDDAWPGNGAVLYFLAPTIFQHPSISTNLNPISS